MALMTAPASGPPARFPALPVIKHPISRLGNRGELSVLGSSRAGSSVGENKSPLPPLRQDEKSKKRERGKHHSRGLTWPFGQEKPLDQDGRSSLQSLARTRSVDELEELVRDKLSTGFYGIRQAFRANDPQGKGNVSREALTTILYHLCGYVSAGQVSGFLKRLGVESQSTISYDDFISHFKDTEVVQKEWIDPVLRPTHEAASLPANRLRVQQRDRAMHERHQKKKQGHKRTPPTYHSALQVFPLLKRKAKEGLAVMTKYLPASCFDIGGMILKPQLRQALFLMGVEMYDQEFEKVWDRLDQNGLGAVDNRTFFVSLGLGIEKDTEKAKTSPSVARVPEILEIPAEPVEPVLHTKQDLPVKPAAESEENAKHDEEKDERDDVMALLTDKFKEGYNSISHMFAKYDPEYTGKVSKSDFRHVLAAYRLALGPVEVEHFLSRFGVRHEQMVPYRRILDQCQDRTDKGLLQYVMADSRHRFNKSRDSQIGNSTAVDAEARLLDILHSDFLSLLGAFKQLDREDMGVVKKYQFKELLEARFGIRLTKGQIAAIRQRIGDDPASGLVPYPRFLDEFSCVRTQSPKASPEARVATSNSRRPSTCPTNPPSVQSDTSPRGVERSASQTDIKKTQPQDVDELLSKMGTLLTEKFDVINKTFIGMDKASRNSGNLTRETFRKLFERHDMRLSGSDVARLWSKLPVEQDGTLNFIALVKTYFASVGRTPPTEKQAGHLSRVLQAYARAHVKKTLDRFLEEEEDAEQIPTEACDEVTTIEEPRDEEPPTTARTEKPKLEATMNRIKLEVRLSWNHIRDDLKKLDKQETGTVDSEDFKGVLKTYCKSLTDAECDVFSARFDKSKDQSVSYLDFLKFFLPTMPEGTNPVGSPRRAKHVKTNAFSEERRTPSQVSVVTIMNKIRNKMISDWKTLRRAMKKSDMSGDGMVAVSDFRATMIAFDFPLDEEDFYHIYSAFDVNMDGKMSYVEFMKQALD